MCAVESKIFCIPAKDQITTVDSAALSHQQNDELTECRDANPKDFGSNANYLGSQLRIIQNILDLAALNASNAKRFYVQNSLNPKYFAFERKRERFRWGDDTAKRFQ
jgi:hypothetical protein